MIKITTLLASPACAALWLESCSSQPPPTVVAIPVAAVVQAAPLELEVVKADSEETSGEDA
jgi:hypothetical protein